MRDEEMVCFGVIVEIEKDEKSACGNHACSLMLINPNGEGNKAGSKFIVEPDIKDRDELFCDALKFEHGETAIDFTKRQGVMCLTPVFTLGEILVIGSNDRTIPDGRKPSKWFVTCEYFNDIESAVKRSKEVTA